MKEGKNPSCKMSLESRLVHPVTSFEDVYGSMAIPLYQTATFGQPAADIMGEYDYTRSGNPTRAALEAQMCVLEGGTRSFAFASGMAALSVTCGLVCKGQRIVAGEDIYGGTSRLLAEVIPTKGIEVENVDTTDIRQIESAISKGNCGLLLLESPTNPRMQICDLSNIIKLTKSINKNIIVCVDNSIMGPIYQRPLDLGADISMTSATKFIAGHSDVTGGILSVNGPELAQRVAFLSNAEGAILAPFESWLAYRGLKTMKLRMDKQSENCLKIAKFLSQHSLVECVNYPGLVTHPGYDIHQNQSTSFGSLLSFTTGNTLVSKSIVESTNLFEITVSFGSVTSLISMPCYMSHASIPAEVRQQRGLPDDLIRISAGIELIDDLIQDLEQAMHKAKAYLV
eukprot:TRINITY_DN10038_c0_g1_i2.p1 TRINITY_DN10038_c0_g1~~TRINITY_DN10038_c0_g1_i2.p1  ORF type:complete len:445 (-),score=26.30 TRINITY_DN10038_c0_g1_i2:254-1447(-)